MHIHTVLLIRLHRGALMRVYVLWCMQCQCVPCKGNGDLAKRKKGNLLMLPFSASQSRTVRHQAGQNTQRSTPKEQALQQRGWGRSTSKRGAPVPLWNWTYCSWVKKGRGGPIAFTAGWWGARQHPFKQRGKFAYRRHTQIALCVPRQSQRWLFYLRASTCSSGKWKNCCCCCFF